MKNELNFERVIARLKVAINASNDADLAARMGMKTNTFANRKKAGSLPYEEIILLSNSENVNFNWLFTGEGQVYRKEPSGPKADHNLEPRHINLLTLFDTLNESQQREILAITEEKERLNRLDSLVADLQKKLG